MAIRYMGDNPGFVAVLTGTDTNLVYIADDEINRDRLADGKDMQLFINKLLGIYVGLCLSISRPHIAIQ